MKTRSVSGIALSLSVLGSVQAQVEPPPTEAPQVAIIESKVFMSSGVPLTPVAPSENSLVAFGGAQSLQQMRERLTNPEQRALLRAEQRAELARSHEDVGRVLGIDAATQSALVDLLTDQQMVQLDTFHRHMANATVRGESMIDVEAARQTRRVEALRELLGEQGLEQYQAFEKTLGQRSQIRQLNARLDPANKLTPQQTEQMVLLYQAHYARLIEIDRGMMFSRPPLGTMLEGMPTPEEMQRRSLLMTIESNERHWRNMPGHTRMLRDQAAAVLTPTQLAMLSKIQTEHADQQQRRIEQMRLQAGLSPQIPAADTSTDAAPARIERDGEVKVSIRLSIDRKQPTIYSQVVPNGSVVTFEIGDGMFMDATPTLYQDGQFDIQLTYHEAGNTGRRLIGERRQMGDIANQSTLDLAHSGGSTSVVVGRKAYVVDLDTRIEGI